MPDLSETVHVEAPAAVVYALVSDLPRMGEWSPECTLVRWRGDATGPAAGAGFTGYNRSGWKRWRTTGTVVRADPGSAFVFAIRLGPMPAARWAYRIAPTDAGACTVTEEWTDLRPPGVRAALGRAFGTRRELNRAGIVETLANLKTAAEAA
ncbi:MAG: SRPBCC family protein [Streptosporangiales bacterium]|nr:SRPBCC family protein [Streptosporangiales bacterium]